MPQAGEPGCNASVYGLRFVPSQNIPARPVAICRDTVIGAAQMARSGLNPNLAWSFSGGVEHYYVLASAAGPTSRKGAKSSVESGQRG